MDKQGIYRNVKELIEKGYTTIAEFAREAKTSVVIIKKVLAGEPVKDDQLKRIEEVMLTYLVKGPTAEDEKPETAADPYTEAVNAIINEESFSRALSTILDIKEVLKEGNISTPAATACANILNRELKEISKAVTKVTLGI